MFLKSTFVQVLAVVAPVSAGLFGIDDRDRYEEGEHILVDNGGHNSDGIYNAVNPCTKSVDATALGEINGGQWIRLPFHDFVTADVVAGTGGLDASIGFESLRAENSGRFVNESLQFFGPDISGYMSMADMIAIGAIVSVAACGESKTSAIGLRVGRTDASEAGPAGVPEPTTDIEITLAQFAAAGFNQSDTIALTACGHTVGHIHYSNFPDIVDESYVTVNNTEGGVGFDSTPTTFDNTLVNEYLTGEGMAGGPLVTASNSSDRSDYRLYISDNNVTMNALVTETAFDQKCYGLFERMLNTVPASVTLSDVIVPMVWKAIDLLLDLSSDGILTLSGEIRHLYTSSETAPTTATYTTSTSSTNSSLQTTDAYVNVGTSQFGSTTYYAFNTTLDRGTTSLNIEDQVSYPINDNIFVLPIKSTVSSSTRTVTLYAASLTQGTMTGVLMVPESQTGTVTHVIQNTTMTMTEVGTAGDYFLYEGNATVSRTGFTIIGMVYLGDGEVRSKTIKSDLFTTI